MDVCVYLVCLLHFIKEHHDSLKEIHTISIYVFVYFVTLGTTAQQKGPRFSVKQKLNYFCVYLV